MIFNYSLIFVKNNLTSGKGTQKNGNSKLFSRNFRFIKIKNFLFCRIRLEFCTIRSAWEWNNVTNVLHTCNEEDEALET